MRGKRPLVFIGAGLVCAVIAVVAVNKKLSNVSQSSGAAAQIERVDVLLSLRDIGYGELLVLVGHGEGENENVNLIPWPKDTVPEGAIKDEELVTNQQMRARFDIFKHEVILRRRIGAEGEFKAPDMTVERLVADGDDMKSGRFRPGMKVDLLRIAGNKALDFMKCVQIYAIGRLDRFGLPAEGENLAPNVFLLIKKADQRAFIEARLVGNLILVEAADPDGEGPVLAGELATAGARAKEAGLLLKRAQEFADAGENEKALAELEQIADEYGNVANVSDEAAKLAKRCRELVAAELYESARRAFEENKDYALALQLLDRIEQRYAQAVDTALRARELRPTVEAARQKQDQGLKYRQLLEQIGTALTQGNLPLAEQKLPELGPFVDEGFEPEGDLPAPAKALGEYTAKLKESQREFELDKRVLETHVKRGDYEQAREKLKQMQQTFSAHPQLGQLEKAVAEGTSATG